MKLPLALSFFVAVFQFGTSNILSKRGIQELLSSDATAVQNGSDVIMVKPGPLEVVLNNANELAFEVCSSKCTAGFLVCYESDSSGPKFLEGSCDTKCGFYITTQGANILFNNQFSKDELGVRKLDRCFQATMKNEWTHVSDLEEDVVTIKTCAPKVKNGVVKLNIINATSDCLVSIKNAKIKPGEIIATSPNSPANPPPNSPSNDPSSAAAKIIGIFGWIFALFSFCILHH
uniref:Uncharacterized protein n=1 Tax=Panagrolaimus davidi TaxID=227884 RepID=A0A914R5A4_9BILA